MTETRTGQLTFEQRCKIRSEADERFKHMYPQGPYGIFGFFGGGMAAIFILGLAGIDAQVEKGYVVLITALVAAAIGHFYEKHRLAQYFAEHKAYLEKLENQLIRELRQSQPPLQTHEVIG